MNASTIEALGKLGIATIAVAGLIWILHSVVNRNAELTEALAKQVEMAERQTQALERLVGIYSGNK